MKDSESLSFMQPVIKKYDIAFSFICSSYKSSCQYGN